MKLAKIRNEILTNVSQKICRIVRPEIRYQLLDHTTKVENIIIERFQRGKRREFDSACIVNILTSIKVNDVDFQLRRSVFKNDSLLKDLYN